MKKNKKKLLLATAAVITASAVSGIVLNSEENVEASSVKLSDYVKNIYPGDIITIEGVNYHYINTSSQGIKVIATEPIKKAFDTGGKNEFSTSRSANIGYYLNRTYYNSLSTKFKSLMVSNATWNIGDEFNESGKTITANVGLLSFWEFSYSLPKSSYAVNGAKLPYFTDAFEWSITPSSKLAANAWPVHPGYGNIDYNLETKRSEWVRPAVILKSDILIDNTNGTVITNQAPKNKGTIPSQTITGKGTKSTVTLSSYFEDADGDKLTYTAVSNSTSIVATSISSSGILTLTGQAKGGSYVSVTATDPSGLNVTQQFYVTVNNTPPVKKLTIPSQTISGVGQTKELTLSTYFSDADNDNLSYKVTNSTNNVIGSVSNGVLRLTGNQKGTDSITVTAMDSSGETISQTFTTTVSNSSPTNKTTIPAQMIDGKGEKIIFDLSQYFQDLDNESLTYTVNSNTTSRVTGSVSGSTLTLTGVAKGPANITITAKDSSNASVTQTFTTTVNNSSPTIKGTIPTQEMSKLNEKITLNLTNYFQDIDGDSISYTVSSSATDKVSTAVNGSNLTLTSVGVGSSTITVTALDGDGGIVSQTFITDVNAEVPFNKNTIAAQVLNGTGQSKQLTLSDYFEDASGNLTYTVTSSEANKVSTILNGDALTLTAVGKGVSNITVTAKNPYDESISQTFTTTVNNTSPTLTTNFNKLTLRPGDVSSVIVLTGTDPDNDDLSYVVSSSNDNVAKVTLSGNQLIVEGLIEGSANIMVKVIDGDLDYGNTVSTKTFTVDVAHPSPTAPEEPIDVDNTGVLTNGTVNLGDIFDDENPNDLIFKPNILVNEPEADISIQNQMLVIENPKNDGLISVEVEATNIYGKTAVATLNMLIEVDNSNQNETKDGKVTLKLMQGEFTLKTSDSNSFGKVKLTAAKQTVTTDFAQDFGVVDARGTQEGWNVTVSATPFTVETFDGFVGVPHQLPLGSLALNNVTGIERLNHINVTDGLPTGVMSGLNVIDTGNALNVLNANQGEGLGEFQFNFGADALALTVDAGTAKIDTVNYPISNTPYASTVTWNLISGPQM